MALVAYELSDGVAVIRLDRPHKRNAISDALLAALADAVDRAQAEAKVVVLGTTGEHFSAGLDLDEHSRKDVMAGIAGSRSWHALFTRIQRGPLPVVAALRGAVIGGGFELAATAHIRVAEPDTWFGMPEGQRGIFVGGGGSVNITRLIGVPRMTDMMLTGRTMGAEEAGRIGAVNYLAEAGQATDRAREIALRIAGNAPLSNYATINALQRIHDSGYDEGLFFESMIATLTATTPEALGRMRAFVEKRAAKVAPPKPGKVEMSALAEPLGENETPGAGKAAVSLGGMERQAGLILRIAQLTMFERLFALLEPSAVKISEITVLIAIDENPGIRQGEIADVLKIKWPNMTKLVRAMEQRGLVERHIPQHDRRSVVLGLTDAGRAAIAASAEAMFRADREALSMLGDDEHAQLLTLSRKIAGWPPATQE